jgi:hypothetical protein
MNDNLNINSNEIEIDMNNRRIQVDNIRSYSKLPISRFKGSNSIRAMRYAEPYKWDQKDECFDYILVEKDWKILGWNYSKNLPWKQSDLRQDMLVVMFESPELEVVWSHFINSDTFE